MQHTTAGQGLVYWQLYQIDEPFTCQGVHTRIVCVDTLAARAVAHMYHLPSCLPNSSCGFAQCVGSSASCRGACASPLMMSTLCHLQRSSHIPCGAFLLLQVMAGRGWCWWAGGASGGGSSSATAAAGRTPTWAAFASVRAAKVPQSGHSRCAASFALCVL